jgi:biotin carboxyl carrier protein
MAVVEVKSDIAGSVWKINVKVGDKVKEEQALMILESMKMEIPVLSPEDGTVKEIRVQEEDVIKEEDVILLIETP